MMYDTSYLLTIYSHFTNDREDRLGCELEVYPRYDIETLKAEGREPPWLIKYLDIHGRHVVYFNRPAAIQFWSWCWINRTAISYLPDDIRLKLEDCPLELRAKAEQYRDQINDRFCEVSALLPTRRVTATSALGMKPKRVNIVAPLAEAPKKESSTREVKNGSDTDTQTRRTQNVRRGTQRRDVPRIAAFA
jgi:hypothetical protein